MCTIQDFNSLKMTNSHRQTLESELELWHRCYLPIGKTVVDLGAGCGETALFYLNHGADKVICIESDDRAIDLLHQNFGEDSRIVIVQAHVDSIKVDIEGGEKGMIIETHFPTRFKRLTTLDAPHVKLWRIEEYWGSLIRKALRKIGWS